MLYATFKVQACDNKTTCPRPLHTQISGNTDINTSYYKAAHYNQYCMDRCQCRVEVREVQGNSNV